MTRTDPLTPEQLEPVVRALGLATRSKDRAELERHARAVITAAIDAGLVVRAEERDTLAYIRRLIEPEIATPGVLSVHEFAKKIWKLLPQPEREDPLASDG